MMLDKLVPPGTPFYTHESDPDYSYSRGEAIFRGECGSCHTLSGYRPLKDLLAGRDRANIGSFITMLHEYKPDSPYRRFMPPMVGTKQDVDDLTGYLNAQVNPAAPGAQKLVQTAQKSPAGRMQRLHQFSLPGRGGFHSRACQEATWQLAEKLRIGNRLTSPPIEGYYPIRLCGLPRPILRFV